MQDLSPSVVPHPSPTESSGARIHLRHKERSFSHVPPKNVTNCWPGTFDPQFFPVGQREPNFYDVAVLVQDYLDDEGWETMESVHPDFTKGSLVLPCWISKLWQPMRRRLWGFGAESADRKCNHDKVNPVMIIHQIWRFLTPRDRRESMKACKQWKKYAQLRRFAATTSLCPLKQPRTLGPGQAIPMKLCKHRAWLNSAGLLRFDFIYGDFIRYLGGNIRTACEISMLSGK